MLKTKTLQKGFTIVELLIVIVVIGILAALVLNTFSGVQKRARDSERQTDVNSVATQLEVYYNDHGGYPALGTATTNGLANAAWITGNFKGLDAKAIVAPGLNVINSFTVATAANKDQYGYATTPAGCVSPTNATGVDVAGTHCASFTLSYFKENGGVTTKTSLNN